MRRHDLMPRRSIVLAVLSLLTVSLMASAAIAAERVAPQSSGSAKTPPPAADLPAIPENAEEIEALKGQPQTGTIVTRRPARTLTPMMAEILAYMESRDLLLAAKRQQYQASKSDRTASAALQQEMQQMKLETELAVLRIQARHAMKEGRTADAQRIETSIQERLDPQVKLAPEKRPVPQSSTGR